MGARGGGEADASGKLAVPAHLRDIGAGQRRDVAARLVVARTFGDDGRGRGNPLGPVERQAKAVAHLAGADLCRGEAPERPGGLAELVREPGRGHRLRRGRKAPRAGSIRLESPVGACGPTNNCSRPPPPRWTTPPSVNSAVNRAWVCMEIGCPPPRPPPPPRAV